MERQTDTNRDGFTLIELLIVIVILGILATVVVFAVSGVRDKSQDAACDTEQRTLIVAVESYRVVTGLDTLPEPVEQTLIDARLLTAESSLFDIGTDGSLIPTPGC